MPGVVALVGGVGGAKLAFGLDRALAARGAERPENALTVVVNTGDDLELHGLHVSPDLDTVMYTLAGLADPDRGWGLAHETWNALEQLERYGAETWFRLGDRDLGTHIRRTERLREGATLSEVTRELADALEVRPTLLPMTDDDVRTKLRTDDGWLDFQEWFVRRRQADRVVEVRFEGADRSRAAPGALEAIGEASLVVLCPSNPFVSIAPILAVPGILGALRSGPAPVVAVTPIVAGRALRGPADRMLEWLGTEVSPAGVAQLYAERYPGLLRGFVIDEQDDEMSERIELLGIDVLVTDTVMASDEDRAALAGDVVQWSAALSRVG
jgi:LPPG:FO 2-phospho-L-lactate transferase